MPSKKRKYNARFPAGRIKKIMQTDEEVGKVAQAVPIIISRTLELFVESLLSKAMQVTVSRNAKTLSPSHVKQCILAESRFDFLRDLVKNIPDVSAAEEKEMMSAEDSPNSSRFPDAPPRKIVREDSNSSSSSDVRLTQIIQPPPITRSVSSDLDTPKVHRTETVTSTVISTDTVIDLSKKATEDPKPIRTANFYQETLLTDEVQHKSVIQVNPTYSSPQPSTSTYTTLTSIEPIQRTEIPVPKPDHKMYLDLRQQNNNTSAIPSPRILTPTPRTPITLTPRTPTTLTPRTPTTLTPRTPTTLTPRTPTTLTPKTPTTLTPKTPTSLTPRTPITLTPRTPTTLTSRTPVTPSPRTPITPILNIDFSKGLEKPEIKVLDAAASNIPYSVAGPKSETTLNKEVTRQNSKSQKAEFKAVELKPNVYQPPFNMDHINTGNLQIDEDYDT